MHYWSSVFLWHVLFIFFLLNWMQEFTWPWTVFLQDCYEYAFRYNMLLLHLCCMFMYEDIPFGSATVSLWLPKCTVMFFEKKLFVFIARYLWCFVLFVLLASLCVNVFFISPSNICHREEVPLLNHLLWILILFSFLSFTSSDYSY